MSRRYHPRGPGQRLRSIEYKETTRKNKMVFPKPDGSCPPYLNSNSKSKSSSTRKNTYKEYRKREVFQAPYSYSKSKSKSRKKREKLHKLRNAHGNNAIHYSRFWVGR